MHTASLAIAVSLVNAISKFVWCLSVPEGSADGRLECGRAGTLPARDGDHGTYISIQLGGAYHCFFWTGRRLQINR